MAIAKIAYGRRAFIKNVAYGGGGMMIGFSWLASCELSPEQVKKMPKEWFTINGYLKIGENGLVTIQSPNPEIGQNVKTSMPMIVAEELDTDWDHVIVEQAPLNTDLFKRQLAGGSQSIRQGWQSLRMAGATARQMLILAAAQTWEVPASEITTAAGMIYHEASGKKTDYGAMASIAATIPVPEEVELKEVKDFKIIGTSRKNVDGSKIVTGKPLFGIDYKKEAMLTAMVVHPPAFGLKLKSMDDSPIKNMPGIRAVFPIQTHVEGYNIGAFDMNAFNDLAVIVGDSTWEVMQAKKALQVTWEDTTDQVLNMDMFGRKMDVRFPAGKENTSTHQQIMETMGAKKAKTVRKDGNPDAAFRNASKIIERSYSCPFLAHNTMEPMNFFADVTEDQATLVGPIQTPEIMERSVSNRLGIPVEKIDIQMTRMGGGFGRRLYGHFLTEAAVISQQMKAPVKLIYSREDDMTQGTYRPAYHAYYRAALDADNNLIGFHVRAGGIPESPLAANRFPAGAIDNYWAEEWTVDSNITVGAFRAPRSNFIAGAEQAFLDEVAEAAGKDPIEFRLSLLDKAKQQPVGDNNDYDAARYAGVLELVKEKAHTNNDPNVFRGIAAYFCHNSYVANVLDMVMEKGKPVVQKVYCAIDCGIVVNPDAATNLAEGGVVDGIGHAMYSAITFNNGVPEQNNFDKYRLIRHDEAPKEIEVHFVKNEIDPTGLGEPPFPPIMGALANALYRATGRRHYNQPFITDKPLMG
ncbi:molybdopterin-dependent oxidoreductase [Flavobacteriaceae bacterium]|nr:molybdopterin-dependent oxidoreductase [Flavobacteriaceae bacterium]MDA8993120.1 molybdopterin-dependent oxidoreductase [Flavobacteriaceae bacterium]